MLTPQQVKNGKSSSLDFRICIFIFHAKKISYAKTECTFLSGCKEAREISCHQIQMYCFCSSFDFLKDFQTVSMIRQPEKRAELMVLWCNCKISFIRENVTVTDDAKLLFLFLPYEKGQFSINLTFKKISVFSYGTTNQAFDPTPETNPHGVFSASRLSTFDRRWVPAYFVSKLTFTVFSIPATTAVSKERPMILTKPLELRKIRNLSPGRAGQLFTGINRKIRKIPDKTKIRTRLAWRPSWRKSVTTSDQRVRRERWRSSLDEYH